MSSDALLFRMIERGTKLPDGYLHVDGYQVACARCGALVAFTGDSNPWSKVHDQWHELLNRRGVR